uniref:Uncharacterized protein n=1 Tax=Amphiprion percula TaxID=161767 RepID=A0A3P8TFB8_AMPPE
MGFCWSRECGNRPCWAGYYVPCHAGWVGPTVLLCIYGFCSMMRPIEPFVTVFLTGTFKNLTTEQVTSQVIPVWTYSRAVLLVPVLLVTDFLRYKPVIVLQGLTYVTAFLLILVGSGVHSAQLAFFFYSIAMAADVAYYSYIYSVVPPSYYQRVTGYVRAAILLGYAAALITSCFLPMPKTSLFFNEAYSVDQTKSSVDVNNSESWDFWVKSVTAAKYAGMMFRTLILDCKKCYSSMAVLFFCIWAATGRCGFYQVSSYVQVLWVYIRPNNFTAYNGGVDAISTLSGAAASVAVGHVSLEWSVWGELVLGGFTLLIAGALFLMDLTGNIWICYTFFFLFKTVYMPLTTICTFVGTVLQSVLTAVVINTKSVQLPITSQFIICALYFAAISLLFTVRGVYTVFHMKAARSSETTTCQRAHTCDEFV